MAEVSPLVRFRSKHHLKMPPFLTPAGAVGGLGTGSGEVGRDRKPICFDDGQCESGSIVTAIQSKIPLNNINE